MEQTNTMTEQLTPEATESELTVEERLAQITAAIAAQQDGHEQSDAAPKAKLAPFTCPMDPAERAACDSCQ